MTLDASSRPARPAHLLLPLLVLSSGFCGISYEILYTKFLGNLLGNQFTINATVLLTFLLGIGCGTLQAYRLRAYLWAVEAGIGLYAVLMATGQGLLDRFLYTSLSSLGTNLYLASAVSFVLLSIPAFLIGCSVPLFAAYLASLRRARVFSLTYAIYNLGAALTALGMEFVVLRLVGLRSATLMLASLNGIVAAGVLWVGRSLPLAPSPERTRFSARVLSALALASTASAMLQLLMIKLAEFVLGPFNETFSLVLTSVFLGMAAGSFLTGRLRWGFHHAVLLGLSGTLGILLLFGTVVGLYARLFAPAAASYPTLVGLKLALVLLLLALPAVGLGSTIPALLHTHRHIARESGQLLFCSSLANVLGFLLMAFVLHRLLDYGPMLVVIALLAAAAVVVERGWEGRGARVALLLAGLSVAASLTTWNESLLYVGHTAFRAPKTLREAVRSFSIHERFKGAQDVFAITRKGGRPFFFINGYISIPLSSPSEKYVGALASMLSPRTDQALVLGVGSGATTGTVGLVFDHTDGIEINQVVLDNLHRMSEYSFDIENLPRVRIIHDDGIHFIKTTPRRYSLILNTVTTPLYFSSSKLYTLDFLELVRKRLTDDGVYVTWIDARIRNRGVDIVLETLSRVFEHGWLFYVAAGYFVLICSNAEMSFGGFAAVAANVALERDLASRYQMPIRWLPYSLLSTDVLALRSPGPTPVNRLDFPALEFEMARGRRGFFRFRKRIEGSFDIASLSRALSQSARWDPGECAFHTTLRMERNTWLSRLYLKSLLRSGADWISFDRAALEAARAQPEGSLFYRFGKLLYDKKRYDAAIEAFNEAAVVAPDAESLHEYLGRSYYERGDYQASLAPFIREWEQHRDPDVPLRLGMSLIRLGRYEEALAWLDTAQLFGREEEREQVAFWRSQAQRRMK